MLAASVRRALSRMLQARADRDGQARALEHSNGLEQPDGHARHHASGLPDDILVRALAEKVMHGWLQNRHQTLVPLAMNLGRLSPEQTDAMVNFAAVAVLGGSSSREAGCSAMTRWLRSLGMQAGAIGTFTSALDDPRPLSSLLQAIHDHGLGPHAYAAAVVASDQHEAAGRLFSSYVAVRLALPADAVRSIDRRYGR